MSAPFLLALKGRKIDNYKIKTCSRIKLGIKWKYLGRFLSMGIDKKSCKQL